MGDFKHTLFPALMAATMFGAGAGLAAEPALLFKVVSARDEIVIGVPAKAAPGASEAARLAALAEQLERGGEIEAHRYAVKKAGNGDLQQAPAGRVVVFLHETVRLEPYATPLAVLPLD